MERPDEHQAFEHLRERAVWTRQVLERMCGILEQIAESDWDDRLTATDAADLAAVLDVLARRAQTDRGLAGTMSAPPQEVDPKLAAIPVTPEPPKDRLPVNRKERFYTATVLPMLTASDNFAHLHRLLDLCGLSSALSGQDVDDLGDDLVFVTEYNLAESIRTQHEKELFAAAIDIADTPDVLIAGTDWLLAIEAKMFHRPSASALNHQVDRQRVLIEHIRDALKIPGDRVRHVLLLPEQFQPDGLAVPVVTWQNVLALYRNVGPTYWRNLLATTLDDYERLRPTRTSRGENSDAVLTGEQILALHADGALEYTFMGRNGGLEGKALDADLAAGAWRTQPYEVRYQPLSKKHWFSIAAFIAATSEH